MKIKKNNKQELPREKMNSVGINNLSNSDLLALVLGSGNRKQNVLEISNIIFPEYSKYTYSDNFSIQELSKKLNISNGYIIKLFAILEIARRLYNKKEYIQSLSDVIDRYTYISRYDKEYFFAIHLNTRSKILLEEVVSIGTETSAIVSVKELIAKAIELKTFALIIIHNHPSGESEPSHEDIKITNELLNACSYFDIKLLDHVIISQMNNFSFKDKQII